MGVSGGGLCYIILVLMDDFLYDYVGAGIVDVESDGCDSVLDLVSVSDDDDGTPLNVLVPAHTLAPAHLR